MGILIFRFFAQPHVLCVSKKEYSWRKQIWVVTFHCWSLGMWKLESIQLIKISCSNSVILYIKSLGDCRSLYVPYFVGLTKKPWFANLVVAWSLLSVYDFRKVNDFFPYSLREMMNENWNLTSDSVYRVGPVLILFCFLLPLNFQIWPWMEKDWSFCGVKDSYPGN